MYLPIPPHEQDTTQGQNFAEFTRFKFPSSTLVAIPRPVRLTILGGRILRLCKMQTLSSRIGTKVIVSISYNGDHYTTSTSLGVIVICCVVGCSYECSFWLHK